MAWLPIIIKIILGIIGFIHIGTNAATYLKVKSMTAKK